MNSGFLLHSHSLRFALGLWAGSVLALYAAFFLQLEPAQWAGITVWIMFIQTPRLNYAKIIYWSLGTVGGAIFAVVLVSLCDQDRVLFLGGLTLWLSGCAFVANLVKSYNAYGAVLAGYTAAIVSMSAVDQPLQVFDLAVNRVSCIFVGMAAAILAMIVFLPRHPHWKETLRHLNDFSGEVFSRAADSLCPGLRDKTGTSSWAQVSDHLSRLEHTLEPTTAESADSRLRAIPAQNVVACLFCLLAKSQSIEGCFARQDMLLPASVQELLDETRSLLSLIHNDGARYSLAIPGSALDQLRNRIRIRIAETTAKLAAVLFILLRLEDLLREAENVLAAWGGLNTPTGPTRPSRLEVHRDYPVARTAALRMTLAMTIASVFWVATGWPAGAQFVLFTGVVCSLLTLQEDPRHMGWNFLKSAFLCAAVAFLDLFWILQKGEGFLLLACAMGLFLIPAAYHFRKPGIIGSAVPSMLLFYNLAIPSNQMTYDIGVFLNNTMGFIFATGFSFFAFHAILPPAPPTRCAHLLRDIWQDIEEMARSSDFLGEQGWISLLADRIRLLHHFGSEKEKAATEAEACLGLQLGLRRLRLQALFASTPLVEIRSVLKPILKMTRKISTSPESILPAISRGRRQLGDQRTVPHHPLREEALAELSEMESLLHFRISQTPSHV